MMTDDEAVAAFREELKDSADNEGAHCVADAFLLEVLRQAGYPKLAEAFLTTSDEMPFWYA